MIKEFSATPLRLAPSPTRTLLQPTTTTVTSEDTVNLSAPGRDFSSEKVGCGPIVAVLVALCGEVALALAKKIAQETGRALAEVAMELIEQSRNKDKKEAPKQGLVQALERAPRTLAILD